VDIHHLVRETVESMRPHAQARDLELSWRVSEGVPQNVVIAPLRLRQVLNNLLSNAFKFTEHGRVEVNVEQLEADIPKADDVVTLYFSVRDTGIGVPPDRQQDIFNVFNQVDASSTRSYGGTGLGLAICRRLVRMMGGRIWVTSEAGRGSTFQFTVSAKKSGDEDHSLVARAAEADDAVTGLKDTAVMDALHILIVEDDPASVLLTQKILESEGHHVLVVANGAEALTLNAQDAFDLILMDLQMPTMDGLEATRRIREMENGATQTPIIALSAHAMEHDIDACMAAGMNAYISKPVTREELIGAIQQVMRDRI
jgi:CheY-like chemotaxis protein